MMSTTERTDQDGADNGRGKVDVYANDADSTALIGRLVATMKLQPLNYAFVHLHDADTAGHAKGWGSPEYQAAVKNLDGYLGTIMDLMDTDPKLKGHSVLIVSADHGGSELNHKDPALPLDYTIPFYVYGTDVAAGKDLYSLNTATRRDPRMGQPDYNEGQQPIRNGDGGNLALSLLGLKAIPDSLINARQDLHVH